MMHVEWTGTRSRGGLLYTAYDDIGAVRDDEGTYFGEMLKVDDGFDCRSDGVMLGVFDDEETALEAFRVLDDTDRDWGRFGEWVDSL